MIACAVLLGASGCAEPQPWWTATEHLRVFGHRDTELCVGTPPALEREVLRRSASDVVAEYRWTVAAL